MLAVVPTLSTHGWEKDPLIGLDFLLAHFFEADKLQTSIYVDNVSSLQAILEQYGHNAYRAADQVRSVLNTYLQRYYESVDVNVEIRPENTATPGSRTVLTLSAIVVDAGTEYQIQKLALLNEGKFVNFITANN